MKKFCSNTNCHLIGIEQDINNFQFRNDTQQYRNICKNCCNNNLKKYYNNNKETILINNKNYRKNNKEKISKRRKKYTQEHKIEKQIYDKIYYKNNKEKIIKSNNLYKQNKLKNNLEFKLKCNISHSVNESLKKNKSKKNSKSILKNLPYTMQELKKHLENQFEPWMNWSNHGIYQINTWDDNNFSTWTWQIDHIIPHSTFKYTSIEDEEFKKCWALSNLRPLSSKENLLLGNKIKF